MADCIDEVGFGFMFAQAHHPAMRHAGPVRRELGVRTVFNLLGPLTNPAGARRQLVGVSRPTWSSRWRRCWRALGTEHALVVHGAGGLDELTPTGENLVAEVRGRAGPQLDGRPPRVRRRTGQRRTTWAAATPPTTRPSSAPCSTARPDPAATP